jgi:hypothetical protein
VTSQGAKLPLVVAETLHVVTVLGATDNGSDDVLPERCQCPEHEVDALVPRDLADVGDPKQVGLGPAAVVKRRGVVAVVHDCRRHRQLAEPLDSPLPAELADEGDARRILQQAAGFATPIRPTDRDVQVRDHWDVGEALDEVREASQPSVSFVQDDRIRPDLARRTDGGDKQPTAERPFALQQPGEVVDRVLGPGEVLARAHGGVVDRDHDCLGYVPGPVVGGEHVRGAALLGMLAGQASDDRPE